MPAPINSAQAASNSATEHQENTEDMHSRPWGFLMPTTYGMKACPQTARGKHRGHALSTSNTEQHRGHALSTPNPLRQKAAAKSHQNTATPRTCTLDPKSLYPNTKQNINFKTKKH